MQKLKGRRAQTQSRKRAHGEHRWFWAEILNSVTADIRPNIPRQAVIPAAWLPGSEI